jgi:hypothetical protein
MLVHALHVLQLIPDDLVSTMVDNHPSLQDASVHVLTPLISIWGGNQETFPSALALVGNSQFIPSTIQTGLIQHALDQDWLNELGNGLRYPHTRRSTMAALLGAGEDGWGILTGVMDRMNSPAHRAEYLQALAGFGSRSLGGLLVHWRERGKTQEVDTIEHLQKMEQQRVEQAARETRGIRL